MATSKSTGLTSNNENAMPQDLRKVAALQATMKREALSTINENIPKNKPLGNQKVFTKSVANASASQNATIPQKESKPLVPVRQKTFVIYSEEQSENEPAAKGDDSVVLPENVVQLYKEDSSAKWTPVYPNFSEESVNEDSYMSLEISSDDPNESACFEDSISFGPYAADIGAYLRSMERKHRPLPTYIQKQPDITMSMRSILVDWLVEVTDEYKMKTETLYHAITFTDRFLSIMSVQRSKLQLVGTTSMLIASKYEEIYPPEVKDFVYITDDSYSKRQVLRMEHLILKVLAFDLSGPTAYTFLLHFCDILKVSKRVCYLAQYICELTLLVTEPFLSYFPSEIAAASLCLANCTLGREPWAKRFEEETEYSMDELKPCLQSLYLQYKGIGLCPQRAITEKYKSSKYGCVASISPPQQLPLIY